MSVQYSYVVIILFSIFVIGVGLEPDTFSVLNLRSHPNGQP